MLAVLKSGLKPSLHAVCKLCRALLPVHSSIVLHAMQDITMAYTARCARQQAPTHVSSKRSKSAPLADHNDESLLRQQSGASTTKFHALRSILSHKANIELHQSLTTIALRLSPHSDADGMPMSSSAAAASVQVRHGATCFV